MTKEFQSNGPAKLAAHTYTTTATEPVAVVYAPGEFPYEPQMQRIILDYPHIYELLGIEEVTTTLTGMKDSVELRMKGSQLAIPESQLKFMTQDISTKLIEATVVAVGQLKEISLVPGDKVMVYINQLEATIKAGEKEYRIYPERCIICKVK